MLIDLFFYVFGFILSLIAFVSPSWTIWPDSVVSAISYSAQTLAGLNFLLPVDVFFDCIIFFLSFLIVYLPLLLVFKALNYIRGSGGL